MAANKSAGEIPAPVEKPVRKRDRSARQVEKVYVSTAGVGRVYKEASGRYVAQGRVAVGGFRTRRRFKTLAEAKTALAAFAANYEASKTSA